MKFLDLNGLTTFWTGAKTWLNNNYYAKNKNITIDDIGGVIMEKDEYECNYYPEFVLVKDTSLGEDANISPDCIYIGSTDDVNERTYIYKTSIITGNIILRDGESSEVLLGNGSCINLDTANGIPTLNAQGKIDASKLAIDTTLFSVVSALPTSNIIKNRIYLVKTESTANQNIYAEYIYTGDVNATYDANKWEKLGEYQSEVDLSGYVKNTDLATDSKNGIMSASDKKGLTTLLNRYPLSITSLTASPNLIEVGVAKDITFTWTFSNTDFHPVTVQSIVVDGAVAVPVANGQLSYTKTGLAGATSAVNKTAKLTVNGSVSKEVSITYHYPTYVGVVTQGTIMNATVIQGLTKSVEWGKGTTKTLTQNNLVIVYAYPLNYGDLSSIKDANGFDGIGGYTKSVVAINGINYNVYVQKLPATVSNGKYTFA